jgi:Flagellar biosynthesis pathway, component FlhA
MIANPGIPHIIQTSHKEMVFYLYCIRELVSLIKDEEAVAPDLHRSKVDCLPEEVVRNVFCYSYEAKKIFRDSLHHYIRRNDVEKIIESVALFAHNVYDPVLLLRYIDAEAGSQLRSEFRVEYDDLLTAILINPDLYSFLLDFVAGIELFKQRKWQQSIAALGKCLAYDFPNDYTRFFLGHGYLALQEYACFKQCLARIRTKSLVINAFNSFVYRWNNRNVTYLPVFPRQYSI